MVTLTFFALGNDPQYSAIIGDIAKTNDELIDHPDIMAFPIRQTAANHDHWLSPQAYCSPADKSWGYFK